MNTVFIEYPDSPIASQHFILQEPMFPVLAKTPDSGPGDAEVHNFARPVLDDEVLAERAGSMTPLTVVLRARAQRRGALGGSRWTPRADEGSGQEGMISVRCSYSGRSAECPEMQQCGGPCQCLQMEFIRWLSPTGRNSPTSR